MACGCVSLPVLPSQTERARAAICALCPHQLAFARCEVDGKPLVAKVKGDDACPLDKHPDSSGTVRFLRLRWRGVPKPLRWLLRLPFVRRRLQLPRLGSLSGCGCIARLADLRDRILEKFRKPEQSRTQ